MGNNPTHKMAFSGDETCVICQEDVNGRVSRPSCCEEHYFHHDCLMEWAKHKNTCPLDNKEFTSIIDHRGKKINVKKPVEENNAVSTLFEHMLILSHLIRNSQMCRICGEERPDSERAKTNSCDHIFHRECLVGLAKVHSTCPIEDCDSVFSEIRCAIGDNLKVSEINEAVVCQLCKESFGDKETAIPNGCEHRFHRDCLRKYAKEEHKCPDCASAVLFLKCEFGDRIVIQGSFEPFECPLCENTNTDMEPLRISPCGHRFHRDCFMEIYSHLDFCPVDSCHLDIELVHCQYGDSFSRNRNGINNVIAQVTCDAEFQCAVCETRNADVERAKLECNCEFHRQCIVRVSRKSRHQPLKCPKCGDESATIRCLHGDTVEHQIEAVETAEGAVGGPQRIVCTLCEAVIEEDKERRPSGCSHWYHEACIETMTFEFDGCIVCQSDVSKVVDKAGNSVPTPPATHQAAAWAPAHTPPATQQAAAWGPAHTPPATQQAAAWGPAHTPPATQQAAAYGPAPTAPRNILPVLTDELQCSTCGDLVTFNDAAHPDSCRCLFHHQCLVRIKEIIDLCPVCDQKFESIESYM